MGFATYVGVLASLPVASEVSGVSSRTSAEGAVPKGVVEDREKRVSAAVCVANPPLPVEARGVSGFRLRLAPRAHLHPVVAGDDTSCGFEQGEHIVRVAPKLPKTHPPWWGRRFGAGSGRDRRARTSSWSRSGAPNVVRNRVPLVPRTAVELGVHHDGVRVVLAVDLVSPSAYRPTIATDASSGVARPVVAQRFDVAECLRALLSSHPAQQVGDDGSYKMVEGGWSVRSRSLNCSIAAHL